MARKQGVPGPDTKKVYATVPTELYESLEALAANQGRTVASLAAFALEYWMSVDAPKLYPMNRVIRQYETHMEDEGE